MRYTDSTHFDRVGVNIKTLIITIIIARGCHGFDAVRRAQEASLLNECEEGGAEETVSAC